MQFQMPSASSTLPKKKAQQVKTQRSTSDSAKRKRMNAVKAVAPMEEDDEDEASEDGESLKARILALERVVASHDDAIRALDGYTMSTWLIPAEDEWSKQLWNIQTKYNENRPPRGAHPWGPARRPLGKTLIDLILMDEDSKQLIPEDHEWRKKHMAFKKPEDIDKLSIDYLQIKETREHKTLIRLRPKMVMLHCWQPALEFLSWRFAQGGGEAKTEGPPPGPIIREIKNSIRVHRQT
eukprot:TRINITY_DN51745_c0_g2_i1.p2 TRINITY_DN51745_c0_g2~~TRINITY_DN51745_c0_g2_i1.p2  ORF type:complete len:238 (-),score=73.59 TRINITY_DN51745_c0_g2_i1:632-1345(-)